jgi:peptidoglycan/LPS O-acetylase OafA/YrhL
MHDVPTIEGAPAMAVRATFPLAPPAHLEFVDSLRGLAILGVLAIHTQAKLQACSAPLQPYAESGARGVQLFYIVSSFTLLLSLESRWAKERSPLRNYFIRRFFRIAPMFYVAMALYLWLYGFAPREWAPQGIGIAQVVTTALFVNGWHPTHINSVVPGGWSVAVETTFYLLLPLLFRYVRSLHTALWLTLASAIGSGLAWKCALALYACCHPTELIRVFAFAWLPAQMPIFLLGSVLYFLVRTRPREGQTKNVSLLLLVTGLALVHALRSGDTLHWLSNHTLFGVAFVCISLSVAWHPWPLLVNRLTRHVGQTSYSLYLLHMAMIELIQTVSPGTFSRVPSGFKYIVAFVIVVVVTTLVATLTYHLVEVPGQRAGKALIAHLDAKPNRSPRFDRDEGAI